MEKGNSADFKNSCKINENSYNYSFFAVVIRRKRNFLLAEKKKFGVRGTLKLTKNYIPECKGSNITYLIKCFAAIYLFGRKQRRRNPTRPNVASSEFLGHRIRLWKENYCIVSIPRNYSTKPCQALSIFLMIGLKLLCQMWLSKICRNALRQKSMRRFFWEKRKSDCFYARCLDNLRIEPSIHESYSDSVCLFVYLLPW